MCFFLKKFVASSLVWFCLVIYYRHKIFFRGDLKLILTLNGRMILNNFFVFTCSLILFCEILFILGCALDNTKIKSMALMPSSMNKIFKNI